MKGILGKSTHLEKRRGSREQARDYCRKVETRLEGPWEHGTWIMGQGHRSDVHIILTALKEGKSEKQICENYPEEWAKNYRIIDRYQRVHPISRRHRTEFHIHIGAPGTGKSTTINTLSPEAYWKPHGKWFDGFDGFQDVIIDEIDKSGLSLECLLKMADWFPYRVEVKGSHVDFNSKKIYATSNFPIEEWFPCEQPTSLLALRRRIDSITNYRMIEENGKKYVIKTVETFKVETELHEILDSPPNARHLTPPKSQILELDAPQSRKGDKVAQGGQQLSPFLTPNTKT